MRSHLAPLFLAALALLPCPARAAPVDDYLAQARRAWERRETDKALELAGKAIAADPRDARGYLLRGTFHEALLQHAEAIADFNKCLELDPACAEALDRRGSELFKLGRVAESLADFDRYLKLRPEAAPGHWKRGIALYYAGRYDEGRRQFEGYEKVDTNDVENAVWHFLCVARKDGLEKARASLLKIGKDKRVPMMQVYDLYRGALKPADVLAAAEAGEVAPPQRQQRLFYAHLYLGLYYDATGDRKQALEHIRQAAGKYRIAHYMGDVARVHEALLRKEQKP
jgi:lipoprotein NlpI